MTSYFNILCLNLHRIISFKKTRLTIKIYSRIFLLNSKFAENFFNRDWDLKHLNISRNALSNLCFVFQKIRWIQQLVNFYCKLQVDICIPPGEFFPQFSWIERFYLHKILKNATICLFKGCIVSLLMNVE